MKDKFLWTKEKKSVKKMCHTGRPHAVCLHWSEYHNLFLCVQSDCVQSRDHTWSWLWGRSCKCIQAFNNTLKKKASEDINKWPQKLIYTELTPESLEILSAENVMHPQVAQTHALPITKKKKKKNPANSYNCREYIVPISHNQGYHRLGKKLETYFLNMPHTTIIIIKSSLSLESGSESYPHPLIQR